MASSGNHLLAGIPGPDIRVAGTGRDAGNLARISGTAARLAAVGTTVLQEYPGRIVMADPEGSELGVAWPDARQPAIPRPPRLAA
jgi:hypothetical protein